jgi:hypothetical protein
MPSYFNIMKNNRSELLAMIPLLELMTGGETYPRYVILVFDNENNAIGFAMYGIMNKIIFINFILIDQSSRKKGHLRNMLKYIQSIESESVGFHIKADSNLNTILAFMALGFEFIKSDEFITSIDAYNNIYSEQISSGCKSLVYDNSNDKVFTSKKFNFARCKDGSFKMFLKFKK